MNLDIRSTLEKRYLILITGSLTLVLFYILTSYGCDKKIDLSSESKTPYDENCSKYMSPDHGGSNLRPPSQEWIHCQFYKAMSFLNWEYAPPNHWENCTSRTYYFPKINTMFTGIPKTGCSNWLVALLDAEGELDVEVDPTKLFWVHGEATGRHRIRHFKDYDRSVLNNAFSFTVVRNPWTRMVSGYRQKLSDEKTQGGAFRWMQRDILQEMRGITDPDELKSLRPTFEEFTRYLINGTGKIDRHFRVQTHELCIPYAMYDFVVPLEYSATLSQEVLKRINGSINYISFKSSFYLNFSFIISTIKNGIFRNLLIDALNSSNQFSGFL